MMRVVLGVVLTWLVVLPLVNACVLGIPSVVHEVPTYVAGAALFALPLGYTFLVVKLFDAVWTDTSPTRDAVVTSLGLAAVTLFLPSIWPGLFVIEDAIGFARGSALESASITDTLPDERRAYISYADAVLRPDLGVRRSWKTRPQSNNSQPVTHHHWFVPVVSRDHKPDEPVRAFAIVATRDKDAIDTWAQSGRPVQGMVELDAARWSASLRRAPIRSRFSPAKVPVFVRLDPRSYSQMREDKLHGGTISVLVVNALYALLCILIHLRMVSPDAQKNRSNSSSLANEPHS